MIEELLYTHLLQHVAEVGGRIYPQIAKDSKVVPYIVYTIVDDNDRVSKSKSRVVSCTDYRIQIDIYDDSALKAKVLKNKIKEVLRQLPNRPTSLHAREKYEPKLKLFGQMIDFNYRLKGEENGCN